MSEELNLNKSENEMIHTVLNSELHRTQPVCREFGFSRGTPIDRYYIEKFLSANSDSIKGRVLEVGDAKYTLNFGKNVYQSDVVNPSESAATTIVADLSKPESLPENAFDCIICTQTIQFLYDFKVGLRNLARALKPGGSLFLTASGISQISRYDMDRWGEFWRFTDRSLSRAIEECCTDCQTELLSFGNVAVAKAFLDGRAYEEIASEVLDQSDPDYQLVLAAKVTKNSEKMVWGSHALAEEKILIKDPIVLIYHRVISNPVDAQILSVSPENFAEQLEILRDNFRVIPLEELSDELAAGISIPNTVALSFDDGYFDNATIALPLLEKYKIPATFFICSDFIDKKKEFWWDALERLFFCESPPSDFLPINGLSDSSGLSLKTSADRLLAYDTLCSALRYMKVDEIDDFVKHLFEWFNIKYECRESHRPMTFAELSSIHQSPVGHIGVHTARHACLASLSEDEQRRELQVCKSYLEESLRTEIKLCSYPWGGDDAVNDFTFGVAEGLGFKAGIANVQAPCKLPVDSFRIPRFLVRNWNGRDFGKWILDVNKSNWEAMELEVRNKSLRDLQRG